MKRMKKLLAVLLTVAVVMSMGINVFAQASSGTSGNSNSVTITGVATDNHTFTAYQIFSGTVSQVGSSYVLTNIGWGDCVDREELLSYLTTSNDAAYNDGTDQTWASIFGSCDSAEDVATILMSYNTDSALVKAFADLLATYDSGNSKYTYLTDFSASKSTGTGSAGAYSYTIDGLDAGYYLVIDSYTGTEGKDDTLSDYFLQVVGAAEVASKTVLPTMTKTVTNTNGTEANATSASKDDTVSFTLTGTIPSDVASYYSSYTYIFHDTLSTNLSLNQSSISVSDSISGSLSTSDYTVAVSGQSFTVTINNAINYAGETITVTYNATVNSNISSASAGTNSAYVEYSNDPNSSTDTGSTTTVTVNVYTYDLEVYKTKGTDGLEGAVFKLYKKVTSPVEADLSTYFTYTSGTTAMTSAAGTTYSASTEYYVLVDTSDTTSDANSYTISFSNLGEGTYVLEESTTPTGYNTATLVQFTITATYDANGDVTTLTTNNTNVAAKDGTSITTLKTTVENKYGSSIPTTGGIGTTIFYIVGAVLVLGAGVVLITRRRMASR